MQTLIGIVLVVCSTSILLDLGADPHARYAQPRLLVASAAGMVGLFLVLKAVAAVPGSGL